MASGTDIAEARRCAAAAAQELAMSETEIGRLSVVVTELARNILSHARGGDMLISRPRDVAAVEILALDNGPGMNSFEECARDGFSTAGTPGTGLGAIRRMTDDSSFFTRPDQGTIALTRVYRNGKPANRAESAWGGISVPVAGESVCGDGWAAKRQDGSVWAIVCDGLGHGPTAREAAAAAVDLFLNQPASSPVQMIETIHGGLRSTRGASVAVAEHAAGNVRYSGIGNISASLHQATGVRHLVSHNGTAGYGAPRLQEFGYPAGEGAVLVMTSDGIISQWAVPHADLRTSDPLVSAARIYRDFRRKRDDSTVLTVKL
ncbi:MAG: ATP-binding protein [Bryobacteraceae bacterium]|nr:ATP-binding protein [Bryobacteraceae bacterium]